MIAARRRRTYACGRIVFDFLLIIPYFAFFFKGKERKNTMKIPVRAAKSVRKESPRPACPSAHMSFVMYGGRPFSGATSVPFGDTAGVPLAGRQASLSAGLFRSAPKVPVAANFPRKSKPPVNWWFAQTLKGYNTGAPVNGYRNLATHHFSPAAAMSRLSFLPYLFLIPVNGSMYSLMLIWSCIWSSSNCLLIYSWITRSLRPTVST